MSSKNVIITGTSRGIGLELVRILAAQGHQVLALSRNSDPVQQLNLDEVTTMPFDLSETSAYDKVSSHISEHWKSVDILINNAGALIHKPFNETTMEDMQSIYSTNVFGLAELTRTVLPFMGKDGHVVNILSLIHI